MDPATLSQRFKKEWSWLLLAWLAVVSLTLGLLWIDWQNSQQRLGEQLERRLEIAHTNLVRQLDDIDFLLREGLYSLTSEEQDTPLINNRNLQLITRIKPSILTMNLLDADGQVLYTSNPALTQSNYAHRDYFNLAQQPEYRSRLLVSSPFMSEEDGWLMVLARPRLNADGKFDGLISITLNPDEFSAQLASVQMSGSMLSQLVHDSGLVFVNLAPQGNHVSQHPLPTDNPVQQYLASERNQILWPGQGSQPAHRYLMAIRPVCPGDSPCLPLIISLGVELDTMLSTLLNHGLIPLLFWLLIGIGGGLLLKINHQRRSQQQVSLRNAREREENLNRNWRALLETIDQAVWEWDRLAGQVVYSLPWKQRLGHTDDEVGSSLEEWRKRVHPEDLMAVNQALQQYIDGKTPTYQCSYRLRKKSGEYFWVLDRGLTVERDSRGFPTRLIGTHVDISSVQNQRSLLEQLAANLPGVLYQFCLDNAGYFSFLYVSKGLETLFGHNVEALNADSDLLFRCIHPDDREGVRQSLFESARSLSPWQYQYRIRLPDGRERWLQDQANPARQPDGTVQWHGHLMDITGSRVHSMQLAETERLLKHLMNELPIGLAMLDEGHNLYFRNRWFRRLFPMTDNGQPPMQQWLQQALPDELPREQLLQQWQQDRQQAEHKDGYIAAREYQLHTADNPHATVSLSGLTFGSHCLAILEDNSAQQKQHAFLHRLAYQDGLTGLANRRQLDESLHNEWRRCRRTGKPISALMIDIDHFKAYNDLYGHQSGDQCLISIARALQSCNQRAQDLVARYGGEEFVCLLPEASLTDACQLAEKLRQAVEILNIEHQGSADYGRVTISIGVSCSLPGSHADAESLIKEADVLLYQAKQQGRNRLAGCPD